MKKLLIIQFIDGVAQEHELSVIADKAGVHASDVLSWDIFRPDHDNMWTHSCVDVGAIIIGGSPHSVYEERLEDKIRMLSRVVREAVDKDIPVLGICFGHQALAHILGGRVVGDSTRQEKGFARIYCNEEAQNDPLFQYMPESFMSRVNHSDHVVELPEETISICYNQTSPIQAFRHRDKPLWGVQFHPEMSEEDVLYRYTHFADTYFVSEEERKRACEELVITSSETHDLLRYFWEYAQRKVDGKQ